jgi:membrane-bound metal-dependent hydrolase YbcI (DUF457 family)
MLPKWHILIGFLVTLILKITTSLSNAEIGLFFLASFLIDFDHYLYYVIRKRDFNPDNAYEWFIEKKQESLKLGLEERKKYKKVILIFHTLEFWVLLIVLSAFSKIFLVLLGGVLFHVLLDWMDLAALKEPIYFKLSLILTLIKNKNKKEFYS